MWNDTLFGGVQRSNMNRLSRSLLVVTAAGTMILGVGAVTQAVRPWMAASGWMRNPFALMPWMQPSGPVVLQQVQRLARLETCRYNGQVVVRGGTSGPLPAWLAGDRMLFLAKGEVVAGVDLSRLRAEDVQVTGGRVTLRVPPAEILHTALDNRQSEVYSRQAGILTGPDPKLETRVRQEAEERIQAAALESGVLTTARDNAEATLRKQLELVGVHDVRFERG